MAKLQQLAADSISNALAFQKSLFGNMKNAPVAEREAEERVAARSEKQREQTRGRQRGVQVNFRLSPDLIALLNEVATKSQETKTDVIEAAIRLIAKQRGHDA